MTSEEAIQELVELKTYNTTRAFAFIGESRLEALDLAIRALEQVHSYEKTIVKLTQSIEEQQTSEDCISRAATIEYIQGHIHEIISESGVDKNEHTNRVIRAIIKGVEKLPSGRSVSK